MLARITITNTMAVVIMVSLRDGQVTFEPSERTCWMNSPGFVFAMSRFAVSFARVSSAVPPAERRAASFPSKACRPN